MITCHVAKEPLEIKTICDTAMSKYYYNSGGVLKNWYEHIEAVPVLTYAKENDTLLGVCLFAKYANRKCLSAYVTVPRRKEGIGTMLLSAIMAEIQHEERIEAELFCYQKAAIFAGKLEVIEVNFMPLMIYPSIYKEIK